jgi:hypothetical protein
MIQFAFGLACSTRKCSSQEITETKAPQQGQCRGAFPESPREDGRTQYTFVYVPRLGPIPLIEDDGFNTLLLTEGQGEFECDKEIKTTSESIPISRELIVATVNPHGLTALAWAMVSHAGGAPRRCCDLPALDPVCVRLAAVVRSPRRQSSIHFSFTGLSATGGIRAVAVGCRCHSVCCSVSSANNSGCFRWPGR